MSTDDSKAAKVADRQLTVVGMIAGLALVLALVAFHDWFHDWMSSVMPDWLEKLLVLAGMIVILLRVLNAMANAADRSERAATSKEPERRDGHEGTNS